MNLSNKEIETLGKKITSRIDNKEGELVQNNLGLEIHKLNEGPLWTYWATMPDSKQYESSFLISGGKISKQYQEAALYALGSKQAQILCDREGHPETQIRKFERHGKIVSAHCGRCKARLA